MVLKGRGYRILVDHSVWFSGKYPTHTLNQDDGEKRNSRPPGTDRCIHRGQVYLLFPLSISKLGKHFSCVGCWLFWAIFTDAVLSCLYLLANCLQPAAWKDEDCGYAIKPISVLWKKVFVPLKYGWVERNREVKTLVQCRTNFFFTPCVSVCDLIWSNVYFKHWRFDFSSFLHFCKHNGRTAK